eukprot:TRINITY_DN16003_c0_g1_i1.p1 TRINITY_DN16003_c0_g1~~TRINITY_DN16003_c0_g1_i1.p1  ORF type:complete len:287 (+),score=33.97 TRINITY_DN16003_c0_g1_i1:96-956(+)
MGIANPQNETSFFVLQNMIIEKPLSGRTSPESHPRRDSPASTAHRTSVTPSKADQRRPASINETTVLIPSNSHENNSTRPEHQKMSSDSRRNSFTTTFGGDSPKENIAPQQGRLQDGSTRIVLENGVVMKPICRDEKPVGFQKYRKDSQHEEQQQKMGMPDGRMNLGHCSPYPCLPFSPALQFQSRSPLLGLLSPMVLSHLQLAKMGIQSCIQPQQSSQAMEDEGKKLVGAYSKEERMEKISRYKYKIQKWREQHPVNRTFKGRSRVAGTKPRVKGRFVKASEATE